jgi:hypothetical protein
LLREKEEDEDTNGPEIRLDGSLLPEEHFRGRELETGKRLRETVWRTLRHITSVPKVD